MAPPKIRRGTAFEAWREQMGLSRAEAAAALGVSTMQLSRCEAGVDYAGGSFTPTKTMRLLMRAISKHGVEHTPWPA